jgi:hypothetical protein
VSCRLIYGTVTKEEGLTTWVVTFAECADHKMYLNRYTHKGTQLVLELTVPNFECAFRGWTQEEMRKSLECGLARIRPADV